MIFLAKASVYFFAQQRNKAWISTLSFKNDGQTINEPEKQVHAHYHTFARSTKKFPHTYFRLINNSAVQGCVSTKQSLDICRITVPSTADAALVPRPANVGSRPVDVQRNTLP